MLFNPFRANSILFYLQTPFANTNPSLSYCFSYYSTPVGPFQRTAGEIHNLVKLSSFSLSQIAALFSILCYTTENRHKRGAACRLLWRAPLPTVQKGAPTMSQITDFYFPSSAGRRSAAARHCRTYRALRCLRPFSESPWLYCRRQRPSGPRRLHILAGKPGLFC